jgi:hypothetical protein
MLHWFFLSIKYQIWPLPTDPAELRKLAIDLQIPLAYAATSSRVDTSLVRAVIRERLKCFRKDSPYVLLFLVAVFSVLVLLVSLFAQIFGVLSSACNSLLSMFCNF